MATQKVKGSCHCGEVKFEAQIDFEKGTTKCNCKFCQKNRLWAAHIKPKDFKLLKGENCLRSYGRQHRNEPFDTSREYGVYENDLPFCTQCGVRPFAMGNIPEIGGAYVSVNVACLDDIDFAVLMKNPILHMNGLEDDWMNKPDFSAHL